MIGAAPFGTTQQFPRPLMGSGNPVLDEIDQAHETLSPAAKQAIGMSGVAQQPQPDAQPVPQPIGAPSPSFTREQPVVAKPDFIAAPNQMAMASPLGMPSEANTAALSNDPIAMKHQQKLEAMRDAGPGKDQIHNKFLRGLAHVGDAIGTMFLPNLTAMIPGTELHHRMLVNEEEGALGERNTLANDESKRQNELSQIPLREAQGREAAARADEIINPRPEYGAPLSTDNGYVVPQKGSPNAVPLTQNGQQVQPPAKDQPVHYAMVGSDVVAITYDPATKQFAQNVVFQGDPQIKTSMADVMVGNKAHKLLINSDTGETIKDLGETKSTDFGGIDLTPEAVDFWAGAASQGIPLPSMGMGNSGALARQKIINRAAEVATDPLAVARAHQRADTESLKKTQIMRDSVVAFEGTARANLDLFLSRAGKVIDSGSPWINTPLRLVDTRGLGSKDMAAYNTARQVALTEIAKVVNNPSLSSVLSDTARKEILSLVPENATFQQIVEVAEVLKTDMENRRKYLDQQIGDISNRMRGSNGGDNLSPQGGSAGTIVQKSKSTGAYRYSTDGGKTWQNGQPPK